MSGMAGKWRAGKNTRISVGSQNLALASYDLTDSGADIDTTNTESNGVTEGIIGPENLDWNSGGKWDAGQNPLDNPPGMYPRQDGENLSFYTSQTDNVFYNLPFFRCHQATLRMTVQGGVDISARGKNQGSYSRAQGSV